MNVEWLQFILAIVVFIGGCLGVAIRIGYIVANTVNKMTLETDAKIGRVYERFDKYKDQMECNFVRGETCRLTHSGTSVAIADLKLSIDKLDAKIDALLLREK